MTGRGQVGTTWDIGRSHKVNVAGRGSVQLTPANHVASGGEGAIYRPTRALCVKVWEDMAYAVQGRMDEKIRLLTAPALRHPHVVYPEAMVTDEQGRTVGYAMPWSEGWALPLAFTGTWRDAHGFTDEAAARFAEAMRQVVVHAHGLGAVLGDANELNVLGLGRGLSAAPRYIDVDSWSIGGIKGDKVLPTVYDYHSPPMGQAADWFAWACVTFQLLVGVHPYKGVHPAFKRGDMEARMRASVSVLDPLTRLSPATRPFTVVPPVLLDWYRQVFGTSSLRTPPPEVRMPPPEVRMNASRGGQMAAYVAQALVLRHGNLVVQPLHALQSAPLRQALPGVLLLAGGRLVDMTSGRDLGTGREDGAYLRLPDGGLGMAWIEDGHLLFTALALADAVVRGNTAQPLATDAAWVADGRLFAVVGDGLQEMSLRRIGGCWGAYPSRLWSLNANATVFGDGVAVMDALGSKYLAVPFGGNAMSMVRAPQLDGMRVLTGIRRGNTAILHAVDRTGGTYRASILLDLDTATCMMHVERTDDHGLSVSDVVTDTGIIVGWDAAGHLELSLPLPVPVQDTMVGAVAVVAGVSVGSGISVGAKPRYQCNLQRKQADVAGPRGMRLFAGPGGVCGWLDGQFSKLSLS